MGTSPRAVDVVVRFAGTLLQATRVLHGGCFRIGRVAGVDLAFDCAPFPLVDSTPGGFVVRWVDRPAEAVTGEIRIALGLVEVIVAPAAPAVVLARRAFDRRPLPFAAVSLVMHGVLVAIAMLLADPDPITVPVVTLTPDPRPTHVARVDPPPPKKQREPKPADHAQAAQTSAADVPATAGEPVPSALSGFEALKDLSMITGKADLAKELSDVGPLYDEDAANAQNFGNSGGHFDPQSDPAFDSVKVGPFPTLGSGRGAGAYFRLKGTATHKEVERPPLMALTCDDATCVVVGTMDRFQVRDVIEKRYVDLVKCYERTSRSVPRVEMTLRFEIDRDGTPNDVQIEGRPEVARCVSRLVARSRFPAGEEPTKVVAYPMAFWRNG